jgi:hypothetical protein
MVVDLRDLHQLILRFSGNVFGNHRQKNYQKCEQLSRNAVESHVVTTTCRSHRVTHRYFEMMEVESDEIETA